MSDNPAHAMRLREVIRRPSFSRRRSVVRPQNLALLLICLIAPLQLRAETISGTVRDQTGALISNARIEITGGDLQQALVITSDGLGKFASPDLKPGTYSLTVSRDGFQSLTRSVDLKGPAQLDLTLAIAPTKENVTVSAKKLAYANSDPVYRQLRGIGLGQSFRFEDFTLRLDAATFHFAKGTMTMLDPVNAMVTGMVFVGEGHFTLQPATEMDAHELTRRAGSAQMDEDFTEIVFRFSDRFHLNFLQGLRDKIDTPPTANTTFNNWKERMRKRSDDPLGFTEYLLHGETMDNVDADILASIYGPHHPDFFNAYIRGVKHKDLRFMVRARVGAIPQLDSPEEVALVNYDPGGMEDGIWYLDHLRAEYANRTANSQEERRLFATKSYKIETIIAKNAHLFSTATITFAPLIEGERVLKFGLLPNLRVTRVIDKDGQDLYYIQESRKEDGSFYVVLPNATNLGKEYSITVQYEGDKVLQQAGDGSFYVRARESWYPNLNGFGEYVPYDLTFKVPRKYTVISVGKKESESVEQDMSVTHWVTPVPVAVAGFNYGQYKEMEIPDDKDGYQIKGYYLSELPDNLRGFRALQTLAPHSMTNYALEQTRAQLQLCTYYFGKSPYDTIYITEQPDFNFGQSWPNLIYLPISAYTDSTQRWMLFGNINAKFTGFVQEVTPHEVSHQWWGHSVSWASYHDQWLSEGFAEFSAGLFLQQAVAGDWRKDYLDFWERLRTRILEKNRFGVAPNDAGPLWMGLRLISPRSQNAYQDVTYAKGAYVLQMLRSMMYSTESHDKDFIDMMHDFVATHHDRAASTESFKAIAEKHITKPMNLEGNGRLDWFFNEWVYGTDVPRYKFDYALSQLSDGKVQLQMTVTQSEVGNNFAMLVPVFADFGKGMVHIGRLRMIGSTTQKGNLVLPTRPKKVELNAYKEILER